MGKGSAGGADDGSSYGRRSGFIYVFNLIVGVGALALPRNFVNAGVGLSTIVITLIAFFAFMTFTWIIEVLAAANAILTVADADEMDYAVSEPGMRSTLSQNDLRALLPDEQSHPRKSLEPVNKLTYTDDEDSGPDEAATFKQGYQMTTTIEENGDMVNAPLVAECVEGKEPFKIKQRVEMGYMAELFLGKIGKVFFYAVLVIYLFGDLAIYVAMVCSTLTIKTPDFKIPGIMEFKKPENDEDISAKYRFFVLIFTIMVVPWAYLNLSKTKYLQRITMFIRTFAFFLMIVLAFYHVAKDSTDFKFGELSGYFNFAGFPGLFASLIYSFMCHHSVPAIVSPIKKKQRLTELFAVDYILVLVSYLLLSSSAAFSFGDDVNPKMYTMNFIDFKIIGNFLVLFPVFTLTLNFPLIAITLRNNIKTLLVSTCIPNPTSKTGKLILHVSVATVAAFPPIILAFFTNQINVLVSYTGGYAGCFIQFLFPATLVVAARIKVKSIFGPKMNAQQPHASPFQSVIWVIMVYILGVIVLGFTTYQCIFPHK